MFMKFLVVLVLVTISVQAGRLSEKAAEYMPEGMYFYNQNSRMIRASIQVEREGGGSHVRS